MSLLLDALKRAEQEKLAKNGERHDGERPSAAQAAPATAPPVLELQPTTAPAAAAPAKKPSAHAAQVVFQAKTAAAPQEPRNRGVLLGTAVGAVLIVVIAAGAYVWHTIRTLTPDLAAARPRPPAAPAAAPAGPAASVVSPPAGGAFAPVLPSGSAAPVITPASPAPARLAVTEPSQAPPPQDQDRLVREVLRQSGTQPQAAPLRLERSVEAATVPRDISAGYESLMRGELAPARRSYQASLASDGPSVDAHLGLATVEAQSGNRAAAALHYRKTLELDPRDLTALAGLAALADHSRPEALESQLREDLSRHPESAALRFALGNLYASQARWTEAQAEFFESYRLDPAVADVLYNLAVSLDHLGQPKLAAEFYRRALDASKTQITQFDPAPVARRLAELRP